MTKSPSPPIRVMLVDDHTMIKSISNLLAKLGVSAAQKP